MTTIINGSSPSITFSDGSAQTSATRPFLNRIINGAMVIDQRNAGASVTLDTTVQYPVDRFAGYKGTSGATITAQRSTTVPVGFTNSIIYTVSTGSSPAASDVNATWQKIEGFNVADFGWGTANAKTVTFSFWVRSSLTGTYSISFQNSAGNRFYVATYTVDSANTFEYKSITITGDTSGTWATDNDTGMQITWDLGYGSNFNGTAGAWGSSTIRRTSGSVTLASNTGATFYITGVQLEVGSTATSFDYRPYGTELNLCLRYYYRFTASANTYIGTGITYTVSNALLNFPFPVPMRTSPSALEQTGTASNYRVLSQGGSLYTGTAVPTFDGANITNATVGMTSLSNFVQGQSCLGNLTSASYLGWSAEL